MKNIIKILSQVLLLSSLFISTVAATDSKNDTDRQNLVTEPSVEAVYAIDGHYTFVKGASGSFNLPSGVTIVKEYGVKDGAPFAGALLRHDKAQPFVYKAASVNIPERGDVALGAKGVLSIDLFQEMTAVCRLNGGEAKFVIAKTHGRYKRLTEVDSVEAFTYMLTSFSNNTAWYMGCIGGSQRFSVEKNYRSFTKGVETASIFPNRTFEGIDYLAAGSTIDLPSSIEETAAERSAFREQVAFEASSLKSDFVRPHNGTRYLGSYNGHSEGCDSVSVTEVKGASGEHIYDYEVCSDKVAFTGERVKDSGNMYASR